MGAQAYGGNKTAPIELSNICKRCNLLLCFEPFQKFFMPQFMEFGSCLSTFALFQFLPNSFACWFSVKSFQLFSNAAA